MYQNAYLIYFQNIEVRYINCSFYDDNAKRLYINSGSFPFLYSLKDKKMKWCNQSGHLFQMLHLNKKELLGVL